MKIIFTTDTLSRGGKERQLLILFSNLPNEFEKAIWTKKYSPENSYLDEYKIKDSRVRQFSGFSDFYDLVKKEKPDVIFSFDSQSSFYSLILANVFKYKFINGSIRHGVRAQKISHYFRSLVAWFSKNVVANSNAGLIANNLKKNNSNLVLFNGIDPGFLKSISLDEKKKLRNKFFPNITFDKEVVFISVANFVPYKDYFTVLAALNELKNNFNFHYIIVGDGPLKKDIEEKINEYELNKQVHIMGRINNVKDYLQIADLMIHSSKGEGVSNAILEAMYSGLPIIASNVGGVPETVFQRTSLLFDYQDKEQLKKCLLRSHDLIRDFNFNDSHYQEHLQKFSTTVMIKNFITILNKVLTK